MARADLILNLIRAGTRGDQAQFRKTVEALAADERAKNHDILADRLIALLQQDNNGRPKPLVPTSTRPLFGPLVAEAVPRRRIEDLILPAEAEQAVWRIGGGAAPRRFVAVTLTWSRVTGCSWRAAGKRQDIAG